MGFAVTEKCFSSMRRFCFLLVLSFSLVFFFLFTLLIFFIVSVLILNLRVYWMFRVECLLSNCSHIVVKQLVTRSLFSVSKRVSETSLLVHDGRVVD